MKKCKKCGGQIHGPDGCRLCPMFAAAAVPGGHGTQWPLVSEALAVHPTQITEAMESAKKKGVPTKFDKQGRPIFTDRGHRAAYGKAYGFYDRSGGYGDYSGPSRQSEQQAQYEESRAKARYDD